MALRNRKWLATALFSGLFAAGLQAQNVEQWCRWEHTRLTANDYQTSDNPYRKLTLNVTFTPQAGTCSGSTWCTSFTVPGYWDGGKNFKIRGTFPAGTWDWSMTCSGTSNGLNCANDPALNPPLATGSFVVSNGPGQCDPAQTRTYDLLEKGLPLPTTNATLLKSLTYGDGVTPYHWRADTTWRGPIAEIKDPANTVNGVFNPIKWKQFLDDRVAKGFNTVLIGVASSADDPTDGTQLLFEDIGAPCTGATYPKSCSRWRPLKYWRQFDEIVKLANDRGMVVVITAVMDPQGNATNANPIYPDPADAEIFARNLAARMAGSHVMFSPSLDDPLSASSTLLDAVGAKLRASAPRHLITAHLAGQSSICDYVTVHGKSWHQIHLFQSGHAKSASNACPGLGLDSYECSVYRARMMPDWLAPNPTPPLPSCIPSAGLTPIKANGNAEAAYDVVDSPATQTIDSAYGVRHTGYASALNGAFGVTLGVDGIVLWSDPINRLNSPAADDMKYLGELFDLSPWQMLQRRTARIKNQPVDEDKKMIMAATLDSKFAMIYMPDNADVQFDGSFLTGLDCSLADRGGWTITWVNPRTKSTATQGACTNIALNGATRKITRPVACAAGQGDLGGCDWVVQIRKVGFYGASAVQPVSLAVWAEPLDEGWSIEARQEGGEAFAVSEPTQNDRIAKQPVVASEAAGAYFVAWESQTGDDQLDILLRRVDGKGRLLDHEYTVNVTRENDQMNPWIATNPAGKGGVIAWASHAQDGDLGGIFARLINPAGVPFGQEIQVNEVTAGRQDFPEVVMSPDGSFVVAWTSGGQDGDEEGVYLRRFDSRGRPLSGEIRVNETTAGAQWLSALEPLTGGGFLVRWTGYSPDGEDLGLFARLYDAFGNPIGGEQAGSTAP
jgi:hypothetical protein